MGKAKADEALAALKAACPKDTEPAANQEDQGKKDSCAKYCETAANRCKDEPTAAEADAKSYADKSEVVCKAVPVKKAAPGDDPKKKEEEAKKKDEGCCASGGK